MAETNKMMITIRRAFQNIWIEEKGQIKFLTKLEDDAS
jgi:hypothetical protein